ncbi:MAG: phage tail protein [Clostridiales Family XIII bacterium]|jgi:microcystin-dependent protein|nr:phage tail protein [Clostridiales Family XIII bacterium]
MNGKRGRQVLAIKYIIRRIAALFIVAAVIAVPAVLGAYSYERDKDDNHNKVDSESNTLSYGQVEPHVRTYIDEEKLRIASDGTITGGEDAAVGQPAGEEPVAGVPVYDMPSSVPDVAVGTVLIYAGDKVPDGFLLCDGREVPRGKYQSLYNTIGDKYGEGDGVTTFNLPDMKALSAADATEIVSAASMASAVGAAEREGTMQAELAYIPISKDAQPSVAPNAVSAGPAFERTGAGPARKLSEPTGPPPAAGPGESRQGGPGIGEKPESSPTAKGAAPAMYFIIKY